PAGNVTRMEYGLEGSGAFGQLTATVYPTYREEYQYDARGRKTQTVQILPPEGGNPEKRLTQSTGYDAVGNRITETDAAGRITRYQYDALNRLLSTTDANAGVTRCGYDVRDNLLTVTDANDNTHTFTYDRTQTGDTHSAAAYTYDAKGQKTEETVTYGEGSSAFSLTTQTSYAATGKKQRFTYPDGTQTDYSYTSNGLLSTASLPGSGKMPLSKS